MIKAGDIALFQPDSLIGSFISWYTRGPSHVAVACSSRTWLDVKPPKIALVATSYYHGRDYAIWRPPIDAHGRARVAQAISYWIGQPYDEAALICLAMAPWVRRLFGLGASRVCSSVCGAVLAQAPLVWRDDGGAELDPWSLTPALIQAQRRREGWPLVWSSGDPLDAA